MTCVWQSQKIHFRINQSIDQNKIVYHFEDEQFNSIIDLIEFYQSHSKPITYLSKCIIRNPICRRLIVDKSNQNINEIAAHYSDWNRAIRTGLYYFYDKLNIYLITVVIDA